MPHSDISGSMLASSSPECFVGRHVLHRLYVPRYPPLALSRLTCFFGLIFLSATSINFAFALSIVSPTSWLLFCLCSFQGAILEMTPAFSFFFAGAVFLGSGDKRTRTADILLAKQALYQLSYTPTLVGVRWAILDLHQRPPPYQGCALTN